MERRALLPVMRKSIFNIFVIACLLAIHPGHALAGGGPDASGYVWFEGFSWDWIDTENATRLTMGDDDWRNLPIPFPFTFYGQDYQELWLASNGYITFTGPAMTFINDCPLPASAEPNGAIYFYWDDLVPSSGGIVSYEVVGDAPYRHFVITFESIPLFGYFSQLTAQIILTETVDWIQVNYLDAGRRGEDATLGVENADGTTGLTLSCDEIGIENETLIYFGLPPVENFRYEPAGAALRLHWDDSGGAQTFIVEYRPLEEMAWTQIGRTTESFLFDPGATECSIRQYRVTALAGEYGVSGPTEAATLVYKPITPTGLTAVEVGGLHVELDWNDNSSCEDGYVVESRIGEAPYRVLEQVEADSVRYVDDAISSGAALTWRVKAKKGLISSDYSDEARVESSLYAVTDLTAAAYSDTKIELNWIDKSFGEQGYAIERRPADDPAAPFELISYIGPDTPSYLDFALDPLSEYAYRIYPYTLRVAGPVSNIAYAETLEPDSPPLNDDSVDDDDNDSIILTPENDEDETTPGSCSVCGM